MPDVVTGQPERSAIWRAMLKPVAPSGLAQPMSTSSTAAGSSFARSMACLTTCAPSVAPCVRLKAPRQDFASGVRAVETMTASTTRRSPGFGHFIKTFSRLREIRQQFRGLPPELLHAPGHGPEAFATGIEHRATTLRRESITPEVHHVDVRGSLRDAFLEDVRTLVDQRVKQSIHDLRITDGARRNLQRLA